MLEEALQVGKLLHGTHEFLEVFEPSGRIGRFVLLPHVGVAGFLQHRLRDVGLRHGLREFRPASERDQKIAQGRARSRLQLVGLDEEARRFHHRHARRAGVVVQKLDRRVAEAAFGHVDDALESEIVGWLIDATQIGEGVADLGALVEARSADDPIGHAERHKPVLDFAHLGGDANEDRDLGERMLLGVQRLDLLADEARLFLGIPGAGDRDLFAGLVFRAQRLAETALVLGDEAGGGRQDMRGGAIVALQPDHRRAGKIVLEAEDVVDLGAAPAIDRLVVVADAAEVLARLRQQPQPEILGDVGVLVLVDQHVAEAVLVLLRGCPDARARDAGIRAGDRRNRRR